jgi:hypothetical protein
MGVSAEDVRGGRIDGLNVKQAIEGDQSSVVSVVVRE